jgi:trans-aconitate 2-methyltransferase
VWDPAAYEAFAAQREEPFLDLMAAVGPGRPASIYDLGCGTGRTTRWLMQQHPQARVVGIDSSPEMIAAAGEGPFVVADLTQWQAEPARWVIANAVLHWVPQPRRVLDRGARLVAPGGLLAIQVPVGNSIAHDAVRALAQDWNLEPEWGDYVLSKGAYQQALRQRGMQARTWDHTYPMDFFDAATLCAWLAATTLRPVHALLDAAQREAFDAELGQVLRRRWPGPVRMPFERRFVVAQRM